MALLIPDISGYAPVSHTFILILSTVKKYWNDRHVSVSFRLLKSALLL